ncbi:MAG: site-2 protease family protein [Phycisphaerales bacterium]
MSGWWVADLYHTSGLALVVTWVVWVIGSIVLHELAHGWAALWQGDDTPRRLNRMTLNPLVHMGPVSLLMFALVGIAWGLMPVNPSKFRWKRKGRAFVAAAGPAMNVALAIIAFTLMVVWIRLASGRVDEPLFSNTARFFYYGGFLNILLAMFNLLPIPPLDGSSILAGLSMRWYIWLQNPRFLMAGMFIVLVIFFSGAALPILFACAKLADWCANFGLELTGWPLPWRAYLRA